MTILNAGAAGITGLTYDGVDLTQTFTVVDIDIQPLPTVKAITQDLAQRAGSYFVRQKIGTRTVKVTLGLNAESRDPMAIYKAFRPYAYLVNKSQPKQLKLNETTYLNAILSGTSSMSEVAYWGKFTITFTAFDPYFYGATKTTSLSNNTAKSVTVSGACNVWPVFTVTTSSTSVTITNVTTGEYVNIPNLTSGATLVVDMGKQLSTVNNNYTPVTLASTYFDLEGTMSVKVQGGTASMVYVERWL